MMLRRKMKEQAQLTTEAVEILPPYSSVHKRRALLEWLKEQATEEQKTEQDKNEGSSSTSIPMSSSESDSKNTTDCDAELEGLSDTETTISAFSEEDEAALKVLEECRELAEEANVFNRHFNMFVTRWNRHR